MAAAALCSTSPPTAVFAHAFHSPRFSDSDLDTGRRPSGGQGGLHRARGGLSSLFTGHSARTGQHTGPAYGDSFESSSSCSAASSISFVQVDGSSRGDHHDGRATGAVNIPAGSSLKSKERSGLHGFGSSRGSSPTPAALRSWEAGHVGTSGLPPLQRPHLPLERQAQSLPVLTRGSGLSRPELRSVGFNLGNDGDEPCYQLSFRVGSGESDVAAFGPSSRWTSLGESDVAVSTGRGEGEGTAFEFLPSSYGSQVDTGSSLPSLGEQDLQQARRRLAKLAEEPSFVDEHFGGIGHSKEDADDVRDDQELLLEAQSHHSMFYDSLVKRAFNVAASAHKGQKRKDGKPYISHCLETAIILVESGLDKVVVAAGLLHDTLDDSMMHEHHLRSIFGDEVTDLVVGVSKLSKFSQLARDNAIVVSPAEASRLRNMFLAMVDFRVVLIKMADRLHNLRTLSALPFEKQQRVAKESLEIFAPLANRLGIWSWKAEIEDICFKYLHPTDHAELAAKLEERQGKDVVLASIKRLNTALAAKNVHLHDLVGRPKNLYSVFRKMQKKGCSINEIFDLRGIRVIVPDKDSCYLALDVVHGLWTSSHPEHFEDYINKPKPNGYQSLHTVVEVEGGHLVEVQIRTEEMHHQAEYGLAAHWQYKEGEESSAGLRQKVAWARFCLSWLAETSLLEKKLRLDPADGSLRPHFCSFPTHDKDCVFGREGDCAALGPVVHDNDPVYVIVLENEKMSVRERSPGSTVADILREVQQEEDNYRHMTVRPLVNQEFVENMEQELQTGDLLELVAEVDELGDFDNTCLPQLLPLHALSEVAPSQLRAEVNVDEMMVELGRLRLKKWFAGVR